MCSDPQQFYSKAAGKEVVTSCRRCDACIAVRRSGWLARAIAEKTQWAFAHAVTLSYNDDTQENRDSAAFFCYKDVREFMKRLLSASRKAQPGSRVKFICAGEQGSDNGRCHWHLIIYSDVDICSLGKFDGFKNYKKQRLTDRADLITDFGGREKRLDWSTWGRGFVVLQEGNQESFHYVLSYCLKDQFASDKARGTARETKSEPFATGLFRMSKYPPLGLRWVMRYMEELDASGSVLPNLKLKVPDMSGYWYPSGYIREQLLWSLVALNRRVLWARGANAPQWPSLLASCRDNENDLEILTYAEKRQSPDWEDPDGKLAIGYQYGAQVNSFPEVKADWRSLVTSGCFGEVPCQPCLDSLPFAKVKALGLDRSCGPNGSYVYEIAYRGPLWAKACKPREAGSWEFLEDRNPDCRSGKGVFVWPKSEAARYDPPEN